VRCMVFSRPTDVAHGEVIYAADDAGGIVQIAVEVRAPCGRGQRRLPLDSTWLQASWAAAHAYLFVQFSAAKGVSPDETAAACPACPGTATCTPGSIATPC
jgi:hypothetical protein